MTWLEDRLRSAALFTLGATLPFLGLTLLALLGLALLVAPPSFLGVLLWPLGLFFLANALHGFSIAFKTFPKPPGRRLKPGEAPALEERLAAAQASWKGPRAPEVLLAPDAWSVELTGVPVAGLFGWSRFHWYIGIFPLLALSRRELDAVLGWETVFWSDFHGWLNLQAKRLAAYWYRVHLQLEARSREPLGVWRGGSTLFLRPYAQWVVMAFQPFLAREFVRTDRAIAERHGSPTLVRALCRMATLQPFVARRVFTHWGACIESGEPLPEDLYAQVAKALGQFPEGLEGMMDLALDGLGREVPPLLRLRLEYLEAQPQVPLPPASPAFRELLADTPAMKIGVTC